MICLSFFLNAFIYFFSLKKERKTGSAAADLLPQMDGYFIFFLISLLF
jgi:hypothetical protein